MNRDAAPRMAVIASNTLTGLGLRTILEKIIPFAEVCVYQSYEAFGEDNPEEFVHYFIDAQTYVEHQTFFTARSRRTILLTATQQPPHADVMARINTAQSEDAIVRDILRLHGHGHPHNHRHAGCQPQMPRPELTPRECEVLAMIARGMLNKQIADRMGIGLTTVISHRRNITEKLGIKSVAGLTIYAVTHGYVDAESI